MRAIGSAIPGNAPGAILGNTGMQNWGIPGVQNWAEGGARLGTLMIYDRYLEPGVVFNR